MGCRAFNGAWCFCSLAKASALKVGDRVARFLFMGSGYVTLHDIIAGLSLVWHVMLSYAARIGAKLLPHSCFFSLHLGASY